MLNTNSTDMLKYFNFQSKHMTFAESWKRVVEKEKNIQIRVRHEQRVRRGTTIVLGILVAGGFLSTDRYIGWTSRSAAFTGAVLVLIALFAYLFVNITFMNAYTAYTDELIRKKFR